MGCSIIAFAACWDGWAEQRNTVIMVRTLAYRFVRKIRLVPLYNIPIYSYVPTTIPSPTTQHTIRTMSTFPHVSGRRSSTEPPHHGINDGSGAACASHSYAAVDENGKAVNRDESLTNILIGKKVNDSRLIGAIVSLGEGKLSVLLSCSLPILYVFIDLWLKPLRSNRTLCRVATKLC